LQARGGIVDAHCHLAEPPLVQRLESVLERCRRAGITKFVCNGTCPDDWRAVAKVANTCEGVFPAFGLHPWEVRAFSVEILSDLERYLRGGATAVGEIGLDRWHPERDEKKQEVFFREQLRLARRYTLPVTVHCLRAWGRLFELLREEKPPEAGFLLHAYSGPPELIDSLAALGAYFSFAPDLLEKRKKRKRRSAALVPADRLLVESDAPYMLPPPEGRCAVVLDQNGKQYNHPLNVKSVLSCLAELRREPVELLLERTYVNAHRLFGLTYISVHDS